MESFYHLLGYSVNPEPCLLSRCCGASVTQSPYLWWPRRLRGSCPRRHSAPDSPVPGHQQSWSRAHAHLCKVCSVQEDVPFHISLRARWLRKQRQVRTHGAVWPAGSLPRSLGLVPALALCCLMTFGRRKAAATDGMQHAGHPILSPWDMPLGKVA